MWPVIGAAIAGALWAGQRASRNAARTAILKSRIVGPRSGLTWNVEYLQDLGNMVVYGRNARVAFQRTDAGWKATRASGPQDEIDVIRRDFE